MPGQLVGQVSALAQVTVPVSWNGAPHHQSPCSVAPLACVLSLSLRKEGKNERMQRGKEGREEGKEREEERKEGKTEIKGKKERRERKREEREREKEKRERKEGRQAGRWADGPSAQAFSGLYCCHMCSCSVSQSKCHSEWRNRLHPLVGGAEVTWQGVCGQGQENPRLYWPTTTLKPRVSSFEFPIPLTELSLEPGEVGIRTGLG